MSWQRYLWKAVSRGAESSLGLCRLARGGERLPPWQSLPAIPKRCKNFFCSLKYFFLICTEEQGSQGDYKDGRGGLGEGWYALRRLEQDQGLGRGHRLAGELWLSVWVSNPSDFKSIFQCLNRNWNENRVAQAQELREVCQDFLGDIGDFQKIADSFIVIFDAVSKEVETEKMKVYWIIRSPEIHQCWMRFERSHEIKFNPKCMQPTIDRDDVSIYKQTLINSFTNLCTGNQSS